MAKEKGWQSMGLPGTLFRVAFQLSPKKTLASSLRLFTKAESVAEV
jgi:hypothetical protein